MRTITPEFVGSRIKKIQYWKKVSFGDDIPLIKKIHIDIDLFVSMIIVGNHIDEYFKYGLFKKAYSIRRQFILDRQRNIFRKRCNDEKKSRLFDDKAAFNKMFDKYLGREWIDTATCSFKEYREFIERNPNAFYKPADGSFGIGIGILDVSKKNDSLEIFNELKQEKMILEEQISQIMEMKNYNQSTINTIRIVTLIDNTGKTRIMAAVFRSGRKGELADNFHHRGLAAKVDIETGIVESDAVDNELKHYKEHPDSKLLIKGFQIPMWDQAINMCLEAASVVPEVRYVGWDVALTPKGPSIIEGNCNADPDITQMPLDKGVWDEYRKLI